MNPQLANLPPEKLQQLQEMMRQQLAAYHEARKQQEALQQQGAAANTTGQQGPAALPMPLAGNGDLSLVPMGSQVRPGRRPELEIKSTGSR